MQTHGAASHAQRVHIELVFEGVMDVQEFKPDLTDRSYYHTSTDIRNHIYKAQHACQLDQELTSPENYLIVSS